MEEKLIIDKVDRISQLPDSIIHHIMSFFDYPETYVHMSLLSKDWFALTASYPILKFHYYDFLTSMDIFFKYVDYTTTRFCEQNDVSAHTLDMLFPTQVDILDRCLGLILKKGVQVLVINLYHDWDQPPYQLPTILLSASSLTSLTISRCKLPSSLTVDVVKFKSLKLVCLRGVLIDEGVIHCLTSNCPLLEDINLEYCYGFERFCVLGLPNLNKVDISCKKEIERVDIEAPNLCYFLLYNSDGRSRPFMNMASCKMLKTFCYYGSPLESFTDFFSNFPLLENLFLHLPCYCNKLKLPSNTLRRLELESNCDLENIDISIPNLSLFRYHGRGWSLGLHPSVNKDLTQLKACMEYLGIYRTVWFQELRRYLDKNKGFKTLKLVLGRFIDVEELKGLHSSPYALDHVDLNLRYTWKLTYLVGFMDAVFWCCRPQSLSLELNVWTDFTTRTEVVKYTYEKLLQQEDQGHISIGIVLCYSSNAKPHFSDLNSCLEALTDDKPIHTITFIKEEVVQEA